MVDSAGSSALLSGVAAFLSYLSLIRVVNCLLAAGAVLLGGYLTMPDLPWGALTLAAGAAFFTCAAGNVVNDILDLEIDRVNRPERVLPSGQVMLREARLVAFGAHVLAVGLGALVNWWVLGTVVLALGLLFAYNLWLKKVPFVGNLVIAVLSALTFLTGGVAVDTVLAWHLPGPLIPAAFALLFPLVREILKDCDDLSGDRRGGVVTLPELVGTQAAVGLALLLFFALVLLTYVPVYFDWFSRPYEVITIYLVDLPLLAYLIFVWGNPTRRLLRIGSLALKAGMLLGMLALVIAEQQK